jgi:hypothetical protein
MAEAVKSGGLRTTALLISGAGTIFLALHLLLHRSGSKW